MKEVYSFLFSVPFFPALSIIANILLRKYRGIYFLIALLLYILLSLFILFSFTDFVVVRLNRNGYKTYYSHNDMVLIFEIISVCLIICLTNTIVIVLKYLNRRLK